MITFIARTRKHELHSLRVENDVSVVSKYSSQLCINPVTKSSVLLGMPQPVFLEKNLRRFVQQIALVALTASTASRPRISTH